MRASPDSFLADDAGPLAEDEPEVLIAGAGPVGLFAALRLAQQGIRVQIVDEERRHAARSYALALHPLSLRLLEEAGAASLLLSHGHRVEAMGFYEGLRSHAWMRFSELPAEHPYVLVVPQQTLEGILESRLAEHGVQVQWNQRLIEVRQTGGETLVRTQKTVHGRSRWTEGETFTYQPGFVIGADGHRSTVRAALGLEPVQAGPQELFAVFELLTDDPVGAEARVVLDERHASVLWPLGEGRLRWSFQIESWEGFVEPRFKSRKFGEVGEEPFPYLIAGKLQELARERAPWFEASLGEVVWSAAVPFERRLVDRFGLGNVWLAGDAAHLASPIGNQSMNVGLREAHELAWRIAGILGGRLPHETLERYDRERRREWRLLQGLAGPLSANSEASPWVRSQAERILPCVPASGESLDLLLEQIGLETDRGEVDLEVG
jgi:NADPH-dependent dioxygenase